MRRYVVIGGGVSGLAAARLLAGGTPVSPATTGGPPEASRDVFAGEVSPADAPAPEANEQSPGRRVVLLEAGNRLGGKILTSPCGGGAVELGPDQFLRRDPSAERLCRLLGLGADLIPPSATKAAVLSRGVPRQLPPGLVLGIPTNLDALEESGIVSPAALGAARGEGERPGAVLHAADVGLDLPVGAPAAVERSAGAVLRPRLGDEIVDLLVDPLLGGINAGRVDDLSLGVVAPNIARALVGHRDVIAPVSALAPSKPPTAENDSPFLGLAGGLGRLVGALEHELRHLGCDVRLTCAATQVARLEAGGYRIETAGGSIEADAVVLALPASESARLLEAMAPKAAETLREISYASVAVATFALDRPLPEELASWSGVLVPRGEGALMTAVTFLSRKWPWMGRPSSSPPPLLPKGVGSPASAVSQPSLVRVSAGRHGDRRIETLEDSELVARLAGEVGELMGLRARTPDGLLHRWPASFPQYEPGHSARIATAQAALAACPGLTLAGALLGGIGLPACISSGERAALGAMADLEALV